MREIKNWIDNQAVSGTGARQLPVWDPATGDQQAYVVASTTEETDHAVATALAAYPEWRGTALSRRAEVMFRFRDLVDANRKEIGSAPRISKVPRPRRWRPPGCDQATGRSR